ncbi:flagellar basal body rod C-terminal domain-containing protein [Undibacterium sp.]|uniref:flagellar basal body rod C-terminal domain-containing protein n=1 Tax=Undibacterium sp. TaxID=1914977 RepID=UPI00374D36E7
MSIPALSSGLSGMQAFQRGLDTSANNIANSQTNGFKPQQASFKEGATGGVSTVVSGNGSNGTSATSKEASGTDLATETVDSLVYKNGFDASAKVVKTADQMLGTLIDTTA